MRRFLMKFGYLIVCVAAVSAQAQEAEAKRVPGEREAQKRQLIERYDANKNGVLDPDEVEHIGRDRLLRWDANKDGKVDQVELEGMRTISRQMPKQDKASRELQRAKAQLQAQLHEEDKKNGNGELDETRKNNRNTSTK